MTAKLAISTLGILLLATLGTRAAELRQPVAICVNGVPLDVEHAGQAAPFVADVDGDGRKDLLVGEACMGRLRIYRNVGTNPQPRFEGFSVFLNGAAEGRVPTG